MADGDDFNTRVIKEFRENEGKVGGHFTGRKMVLVSHIGAKSGIVRTTPLVYSRDGERIVIIASMGGAPTNPAWYHNMVVNPLVTVELGGRPEFQAIAVEAIGAERDRLYQHHASSMSFFNEYRAKTSRIIPVLVLDPVVA